MSETFVERLLQIEQALLAAGERAFERRMWVLTGEKQALQAAECVIEAPFEQADRIRLGAGQANQQAALGRSVELCVIECDDEKALCSIDATALGVGAGMVRAGGLLVLLLPSRSEWATRYDRRPFEQRCLRLLNMDKTITWTELDAAFLQSDQSAQKAEFAQKKRHQADHLAEDQKTAFISSSSREAYEKSVSLSTDMSQTYRISENIRQELLQIPYAEHPIACLVQKYGISESIITDFCKTYEKTVSISTDMFQLYRIPEIISQYLLQIPYSDRTLAGLVEKYGIPELIRLYIVLKYQNLNVVSSDESQNTKNAAGLCDDALGDSKKRELSQEMITSPFSSRAIELQNAVLKAGGDERSLSMKDRVQAAAVAEQAKAVDLCERTLFGRPRRPAVLLAARGRGKSTTIGRAIGSYLFCMDGEVVVTAPSRVSVQALFDTARIRITELAKATLANQKKAAENRAPLAKATDITHDHIESSATADVYNGDHVEGIQIAVDQKADEGAPTVCSGLNAVMKAFKADLSPSALEKTVAQGIAQTLKRLKFFTFGDLLDTQPESEVLVVDEAAAFPVSHLETLLSRYRRILFATTVRGYEGTGRGFLLRFDAMLERASKGVRRAVLNAPWRYSPFDPVERLIDRLLLLDDVASNVPPQMAGLLLASDTKALSLKELSKCPLQTQVWQTDLEQLPMISQAPKRGRPLKSKPSDESDVKTLEKPIAASTLVSETAATAQAMADRRDHTAFCGASLKKKIDLSKVAQATNISKHDQASLGADEARLHRLVSLLNAAHYRSSSFDVAFLLNAPDLEVWTAELSETQPDETPCKPPTLQAAADLAQADNADAGKNTVSPGAITADAGKNTVSPGAITADAGKNTVSPGAITADAGKNTVSPESQPAETVGALLLQWERTLDRKLCRALMAGRRRPMGHFLQAVLATHSGAIKAPSLVMGRILRVAVDEDVRMQGIGQKLLEAVEKQARATGLQALGASFGVTLGLLQFWLRSGYRLLRVGIERGESSGAFSAVVMKGLDQAGRNLIDEEQARAAMRFPGMLEGPLRRLEPALQLGLLRAFGPLPLKFDARDFADVAAVAYGRRSPAQHPRLVFDFTCAALSRVQPLSDEQSSAMLRHLLDPSAQMQKDMFEKQLQTLWQSLVPDRVAAQCARTGLLD